MILQLNTPETSSESALLKAKVGAAYFGALTPKSIFIMPAKDTDNGKMLIAKSELPCDTSTLRTPILIAFQFHDSPDVNALARYVSDRDTPLNKHKGKVIVSAITPRTSEWQFDGFEIIDFPDPLAMQTLMSDNDYRSSTSNSSSVFGGVFAAAPISVF